MALSVLFQCFTLIGLVYYILEPQSLLLSISQYIETLYKDIELLIEQFDCNDGIKLMENFIEMVNFHGNCLK